ncbi:MAG: C25 family cysteine peptidase, partial [Anaerolineae bacterium]
MSHLNLSRFILVGIFCGLLLSLASGRTQASDLANQTASAEPQVKLLNDGLELTWHLPDVAQSGDLLEIAGLQLSQTPGQPQLPGRSVGVALPPNAAPKLTITALGKTEQIQLKQPVPLAPAPVGVERSETGEIIGGAFAPAEFDPTYQPERVTFEEIGTMAGVRLGRVTVHPVLPVDDGRYEFARDITVQLDFQVDVPSARAVERSDLHQSISDTVINPSQISPEPIVRTLESAIQMTDLPTAIIETDGAAGMIQVTHAELLAAGFPVNDSDLNNFHLYRGETEIAWRSIGSGARNDRLEAAESLIFYAPGEHSRWATNEIFRLVAETTPGLKMQNGNINPAGLPLAAHRVTVTAEEDLVYTPQCICGSQPLARDGDRWMWAELKRPGAESAEFEIVTPNFSATDSAELTIWLMGLTDLKNLENDHLVSVDLNGTELGQVSWGGKTNKQATLSVPAGVLQAVNTATVTLEDMGGLFDGLWVDAFEIKYSSGSDPAPAGGQLEFSGESARSHYEVPISQPANVHLYDLTDQDSPVNLIGFSVMNNQLVLGDPSAGPRDYRLVQDGGYRSATNVRLAQSLLTGEVTGATYIIVTSAEFSGQLNGLFALRSSQGYSVVIEEVERIYDQFGRGEPNPAAIQAYLKNAWTNWSPQPEMVLLVGDGHYDPRQNFDGSLEIQIPPLLADVDPWLGETAADNRFVTFDGPDDQL